MTCIFWGRGGRGEVGVDAGGGGGGGRGGPAVGDDVGVLGLEVLGLPHAVHLVDVVVGVLHRDAGQLINYSIKRYSWRA